MEKKNNGSLLWSYFFQQQRQRQFFWPIFITHTWTNPSLIPIIIKSPVAAESCLPAHKSRPWGEVTRTLRFIEFEFPIKLEHRERCNICKCIGLPQEMHTFGGYLCRWRTGSWIQKKKGLGTGQTSASDNPCQPIRTDICTWIPLGSVCKSRFHREATGRRGRSYPRWLQTERVQGGRVAVHW